jgi:hypothetical protein
MIDLPLPQLRVRVSDGPHRPIVSNDVGAHATAFDDLHLHVSSSSWLVYGTRDELRQPHAARAKRSRRHGRKCSEGARERLHAVVADLHCDVGDGAIRGDQEMRRSGEPQPARRFDHTFAHHGAVDPMEMKAGEEGDPRQLIERPRRRRGSGERRDNASDAGAIIGFGNRLHNGNCTQSRTTIRGRDCAIAGGHEPRR